MTQLKNSTTDLNLLLGFHLLVILTKACNWPGQRTFNTYTRKVKNHILVYCLYRSVYPKIKTIRQKVRNTIIVYNHSLSQQTPLHIAAREGHERTVEHLVEMGADIYFRDMNGVCMTILLMIH